MAWSGLVWLRIGTSGGDLVSMVMKWGSCLSGGESYSLKKDGVGWLLSHCMQCRS